MAVILQEKLVDQAIDRGAHQRFAKQLLVTSGPVPLAIVRKRLADAADQELPPVLLVHGFGQNRYAWHLPSRSLVNHLAASGFDVFNLDLRGHGRSRHLSRARTSHVDDYVEEDLPSAIDEVQRLVGGRRVFLVGHSLGGLVSYATAPTIPDRIAGIVSIGSPYHFTRGSLSLRAIAFAVRALSAVRLHPGAAPFPVAPIGAVLRSVRPVAESPLSPMPFRGWHAGALEPHVLDEHLRLAFDAGTLGEVTDMFAWANERRFGGRRHDYAERFEALDLPLLVLAGKNDDLAPPASVRPAFLRSRARDKTYRAFPLGHIDLLVGRDAPATTWPTIVDWLRERCD